LLNFVDEFLFVSFHCQASIGDFCRGSANATRCERDATTPVHRQALKSAKTDAKSFPSTAKDLRFIFGMNARAPHLRYD
jgi:hypothetical protein